MKTEEPIRIRSQAEARRLIESRDIPYVKLGVTDIDGVLRGKYVNRAKFLSALEKGFGFCDVVVGWDSNDQLYDNVKYTGWHTAYPDAPMRVIPETARLIPFENDLPFFLCELAPPAEAICPRGLLRRVLKRAAAKSSRATSWQTAGRANSSTESAASHKCNARPIGLATTSVPSSAGE